VSLYVKHVASNVKSADGLMWDVELGPKTLIVGPNGRGKSRIVNAIELALTGRASDVAGRVDVAREADLLALAPGRKANVYAEVLLSSGETVHFGVEYVGEGKARKADHDVPDWFAKEQLLPVRAVREAMLGSADTACRAFLGWAGAVDTDLKTMLAPSLHAALTRLQTLNPGVTDAGTLEQAARRRKLDANATVKALESTSRASPTVMRPTTADIERAQEAVKQAREVLVRAQSAQMTKNAQQRKAQLESTVEALRPEHDQARALLTQWEAHVAFLPKPSSFSDVASQLMALLTFTVEGRDGDCLLCGAEPGAAHLAHRKAELESLFASQRGMAEKYASATRSLAAAQAAELDVRTRLQYAEHALADMRDVVGSADAPDYLTASTACDAAESTLRGLVSAEQAWSSAMSVMSQLDTAKQEAATWKALEEALGQAGRLQLSGALQSFSARVQGFLPATDQFGMLLSEGAREVFHAGFVRDGALHTALSGAEWARLTLAMASAILPANAQFAVLTPEERAFDPKTLAAVLKALSNCPHQVILTSPIAPAGKLPAGWTLVELA